MINHLIIFLKPVVVSSYLHFLLLPLLLTAPTARVTIKCNTSVANYNGIQCVSGTAPENPLCAASLAFTHADSLKTPALCWLIRSVKILSVLQVGRQTVWCGGANSLVQWGKQFGEANSSLLSLTFNCVVVLHFMLGRLVVVICG